WALSIVAITCVAVVAEKSGFGQFSYLGVFATPLGALALVLVAWIHEMGHRWGFAKFEIGTFGPILVVPLGGVAIQKKGPTAWQFFVALFAGPGSGVFAYLILALGWWATEAYIFPGNILVGVALFWFAINLLNLVPFVPFDGGHIVAQILGGLHPKFPRWWKLASVVVFLTLGVVVRQVIALQVIFIFGMWALDHLVEKVVTVVADGEDLSVKGHLTRSEAATAFGCYAILVTALAAGTYLSYHFLQTH
ncbi:MAG: hypothetical protein ABH814_02895, partial [bacterium]